MNNIHGYTPTVENLWDAIRTIRADGVVVTLVEGEGIAALWNVGRLNKIGYWEVIRQAQHRRKGEVA